MTISGEIISTCAGDGFYVRIFEDNVIYYKKVVMFATVYLVHDNRYHHYPLVVGDNKIVNIEDKDYQLITEELLQNNIIVDREKNVAIYKDDVQICKSKN